jgi:NitT/TauT family transport system permease protein
MSSTLTLKSEPAATQALRASTVGKRRRRSLRRLMWMSLPALTFVGLILLWGAAVAVFGIPSYLLPSPWAVLPELVESWTPMWTNAVVTLQEIFFGFGLTVVLAIPAGLLIALSPVAKQSLYPILVFLQLVPKIAIAPLFIVWVGYGMESKVLLTVLMTFFPLLLASISGFQILDQRLLHLTKSMGATGWQTFRFLRFPAALPVIFSGLKTSATIAATAAVVAEFVGANKGLGYLLLQATGTLDTPLIFAILLVLTVIGIALNYIVELAEYLLAPWMRARSRA